jgi:di/tricarboxylate transporter
VNLGWISVGALGCAILISCFTSLNVGVISLVLAWIVGVYLGGMPLGTVLEGFPVALFATLAGVTLLFSMAQRNGTLAAITGKAVRLCRGHAGVVPIMFFGLAAILSTIGPGGTATAALLAPPAMAAAKRAAVPPFLMLIMIGNGALAGTLSPFAPTGIVASGVMARIGLGGFEWKTYAANLAAHTLVAFAAYFLFGGWRLFRGTASGERALEPVPATLDGRQWLTVAVIAALIVAVVVFDMNIGMTAFAAAAILSVAGAANEKEAIAHMPWNVILMVTGVTVLIALMEKTEGMAIFTNALVRFSTRDSVTPLVAFVTGTVSIYSSTSGVVLPAFLPIVPGLAARIGGVEPLRLAWSMNVGASLVDLSPLSTVGAICLAAIPEGGNERRLFQQLLAWGFSMTVVGALVAWLLFR